MTAARLSWFRQQELLYRQRQEEAGDCLSDARLQKLKSLGFFLQDTSVPPLPVAVALGKTVVPAPVVAALTTKTMATTSPTLSMQSASPTAPQNQTQQYASPLPVSTTTKTISKKDTLSVQAPCQEPVMADCQSSSDMVAALSSQQSALLATKQPSPVPPVAPVDAKDTKPDSLAASSEVQHLPSVDVAAWILPKGREAHCCRHYNFPGGCLRRNECPSIHVQYPWGDASLQELWLTCSQSLSPCVVGKQQQYHQRVLGLSAFANGKWWYTAKYSSDTSSLGQNDVDKKIILAEGGPEACRSDQGISWYPSDTAAKEALQRVVIITYWATDQGIQSKQNVKGSVIDDITKRISDAVKFASDSDEAINNKRALSDAGSPAPDRDDSNRPAKAHCVALDASKRIADDETGDPRRSGISPVGCTHDKQAVVETPVMTMKPPPVHTYHLDLKKRLEQFAASAKCGETLPMGQKLTCVERSFVEDEAKKLGLGSFTNGFVHSSELVVKAGTKIGDLKSD